MSICCRLFTKRKSRITFVHKSLICDTVGRREGLGLFKLTHKNERPKSDDCYYLIKINLIIFFF